MLAMNPDKKNNLNEKAYAFVTDLLTRGELKPGHKLSEPSLAAACGVAEATISRFCRSSL